jgi:hypothetical protein
VDGQPVSPGAELPLLARIGRSRKRGMVVKREGKPDYDILATLGAGRGDPGDDGRPREDQVRDWRPV